MSVFGLILFLHLLGIQDGPPAPEAVSQILRVTVYTKDTVRAKVVVKDAIARSQAILVSYNEETRDDGAGPSKIDLKMRVRREHFAELRDLWERVGVLQSRSIQTINREADLASLESDREFSMQQKKAYEQEMARAEGRDEEHYRLLWGAIRHFDGDIRDQEKKIAAARAEIAFDSVDATILEDTGAPMRSGSGSNDEFELVNMPGFEAGILFPESPKNGISARRYAGGGIKYLFTRGKSYIFLGALRALDANDILDANTFRELFQYGFGQDFYPRHFGRGHRRWLNLYTGYRLGGVFATGDSSHRHIFQIAPHLGLEILKTRNLLFDARAGYFVPFSENRNLRGLSLEAAFNFVF